MANNVYDSKTIPDLLSFLLEDRRLTYRELAEGIGISSSAVSDLVNGNKKASPETLDKLAAFAGLTREFVYELAFGIRAHPGYSRLVAEVAALLEKSPEDVQQLAAAAVEAIIATRKKQQKPIDQE